MQEQDKKNYDEMLSNQQKTTQSDPESEGNQLDQEERILKTETLEAVSKPAEVLDEDFILNIASQQALNNDKY